MATSAEQSFAPPRLQEQSSSTFRLTEEQRRVFDRDGVLVLRGIVPPEEVQELRDRFQERQENLSIKDRIYNVLFDNTDFIASPHDASFEKASTFYHKKDYTHVCAELLGTPTLRYWMDYAMTNPWKESADIGWHVDTTICGGIHPDDVIRLWFPLDECDAASGGGSEYILGSHRVDVVHSNGKIEEEHLPEGEVASFRLFPGDAVVWHPRIVHGTLFVPEEGAGREGRVMGISFFRDGARMDPCVTETARLTAGVTRIYDQDPDTAYRSAFVPIVHPPSRAEAGRRVPSGGFKGARFASEFLRHHTDKTRQRLLRRGRFVEAARVPLELYGKALLAVCQGLAARLGA